MQSSFDLTLSEMHRTRDWEKKLQAAGYRVIDEPWRASDLAQTLPPAAYPPPNLTKGSS